MVERTSDLDRTLTDRRVKERNRGIWGRGEPQYLCRIVYIDPWSSEGAIALKIRWAVKPFRVRVPSRASSASCNRTGSYYSRLST